MLQLLGNLNMDPTKPILDLYSDYSSDNTQRQYKSVRSPPPITQKYSRPTPQKEISYAQLKQKYQQLYQAYIEKVEKVNMYDEQMQQMRLQNERLREQVYKLEDKNEHLNSTLLNKNVELEEAYRQLQEDIKRNNKTKKNDEALGRLEEGLREAISSNFNLLREAALSELKNY